MDTYSVYFFDVDGTLTESKQPIHPEMALRFSKLLEKHKMVLISGGTFGRIKDQVVSKLPQNSKLTNLYIAPTSGSALYACRDGESWEKLYQHIISPEEYESIKTIMEESLLESGEDIPEESYGEKIEHRMSQVSWSAFGQDAPLEVKKDWDPEHKKRQSIIKVLKPKLIDYEVRSGGTSTIDVTKKGFDKGFAVKELARLLRTEPNLCVYVGDSLKEGGNDNSVIGTGIHVEEVSGPADTLKVMSDFFSADSLQKVQKFERRPHL